jgi:hypothetical protein
MNHINDENKLNKYTLDNILIYTGTTDYNLESICNNIKESTNHIKKHTIQNTNEINNNYYDFNLDYIPNDYDYLSKIQLYEKYQNIKNNIFTPLVSSTLTIKGSFSNIMFNEEELINTLDIPDGGDILKICCNYGEIMNKNPSYKYPEAKKKVSNRGRKPKIKIKSKRKLQGSGKYFSSQITFEIYNSDNGKIYKIKLFRNGRFQIPGGNIPYMSDVIKPLITLKIYLRKQFLDDDIKVVYLISVMRNYICKLLDNNLLIKLNDLECILKENKTKNNLPNPIFNYLENNKTALINYFNISENTIKYTQEYIGKYSNRIQIAEIQNNCERYFGLIVKFCRPVPWKINKRTTIKILRSGKINIDGSNSIEESIELYLWLISLFIEYKNEILHDTNAIDDNNSDCSIGSGYSIYDDEVDETYLLYEDEV